MAIEVKPDDVKINLGALYKHMLRHTQQMMIVKNPKDWRMGFGKFQLFSERTQGFLNRFKKKKGAEPSLIIGCDISDTEFGKALLTTRS